MPEGQKHEAMAPTEKDLRERARAVGLLVWVQPCRTGQFYVLMSRRSAPHAPAPLTCKTLAAAFGAVRDYPTRRRELGRVGQHRRPWSESRR